MQPIMFFLSRSSGANYIKDSPNLSITQETWFSEKPISSRRSVFSMVPYNFSSLASCERRLDYWTVQCKITKTQTLGETATGQHGTYVNACSSDIFANLLLQKRTFNERREKSYPRPLSLCHYDTYLKSLPHRNDFCMIA